MSKKRKRRPDEIVCMCNAYDHPHRLGGGTCNGSAWCTSFRSIDSYSCSYCNYNNNNQCDVVTGLDQLDNERCECVADEIRTGHLAYDYGYLPLDVEDYMTKKQQEYYDHE